MKVKRYVVYIVFIAIVLIGGIVFVKSCVFLKESVAKSSDILQIEKHYAALTNCTISFTQQSTMIGNMEGSIRVKTNADIFVEWREHEYFVGDFTNRIYKDGETAIWQRYQSNNTKYPSLVSILDAAKGVSHGVSYVIPMMLLGKESLGDPLLWEPANKNEYVLESKKYLVSFLIVYDPKTYKIIKTSRRIKITMGIVGEETTYVENTDN